ncbi:MAG: hypothetical protein K0S73_1120 [Stenotrophomonas rhizophila]|jgi:hypothetical protein|nr:hypothetical protein [Stenotrophomonas rhizophila]
MFSVLLFLLASTRSEPFPPGYHDRPGFSDDGAHVIIRTALWDDFNGGKAPVEQVLIPNEDGSFTYQYARQSRATRMYHATYCWFQQMYPEDSTSSGPGTYGGWSCGRSTEHPPAPPA